MGKKSALRRQTVRNQAPELLCELYSLVTDLNYGIDYDLQVRIEEWEKSVFDCGLGRLFGKRS